MTNTGHPLQINDSNAQLPQQRPAIQRDATVPKSALPLHIDSIDALLIGNEWFSVQPGSARIVPSGWDSGADSLARPTVDRHSVRFKPAGEKYEIDVLWAAVTAVKHGGS